MGGVGGVGCDGVWFCCCVLRLMFLVLSETEVVGAVAAGGWSERDVVQWTWLLSKQVNEGTVVQL